MSAHERLERVLDDTYSDSKALLDRDDYTWLVAVAEAALQVAEHADAHLMGDFGDFSRALTSLWERIHDEAGQ